MQVGQFFAAGLVRPGKERMLVVKGNSRDESLDLAHRIRASGVPININECDTKPVDMLKQGVYINQFGGVAESRAFDLCGGIGIILYVTISFNVTRFAISDFGLELPWRCEIRWLPDPLEIDGSSKFYRFGRKNSLEFERNLVLNRFADVRRLHPRGSSLVGCLLCLGTSPVPDDYAHGAMIPGNLSLFDQFGRKYPSPVSLWADRTEEFLPGICSKAKRKRLFECPDPGSKTTSARQNLSEVRDKIYYQCSPMSRRRQPGERQPLNMEILILEDGIVSLSER